MERYWLLSQSSVKKWIQPGTEEAEVSFLQQEDPWNYRKIIQERVFLILEDCFLHSVSKRFLTAALVFLCKYSHSCEHSLLLISQILDVFTLRESIVDPALLACVGRRANKGFRTRPCGAPASLKKHSPVGVFLIGARPRREAQQNRRRNRMVQTEGPDWENPKSVTKEHSEWGIGRKSTCLWLKRLEGRLHSAHPWTVFPCLLLVLVAFSTQMKS